MSIFNSTCTEPPQPFEEETATSIIRRYGWLKYGYPSQPEEAACACCSGAHQEGRRQGRLGDSANFKVDVIEERAKGRGFMAGSPTSPEVARARAASASRARSRSLTKPADNLSFGRAASTTRDATNPPPPRDLATLRAHSARRARQQRGGASYLTVIVHKGGMLSVDVGEVGSVLIRCGQYEGQTSFETRRQNKMLKWEERFTLPIDPHANDPLEVYVLKGKVRNEKGGHAVGATSISNDALHSELRGYREQVPVRSVREMFAEDGPSRGFVEMTWQISDEPARGSPSAAQAGDVSGISGIDGDDALYDADGNRIGSIHRPRRDGSRRGSVASEGGGGALGGSSAKVSRTNSFSRNAPNSNNNSPPSTNNKDGDKASRAIMESQRHADEDEDENPRLEAPVALRLRVKRALLLGQAAMDTHHHRGELFCTLHACDGSCSEAATLYRSTDGTNTSLATRVSSTTYLATTAPDGESTGTIAHDVANKFVSLLCCFDTNSNHTDRGGASASPSPSPSSAAAGAADEAPLALSVVGSVVLDVQEFLAQRKGSMTFTLGDKDGYVGEVELEWAAVAVDAAFDALRSTAEERAAAREADRQRRRRKRRGEADEDDDDGGSSYGSDVNGIHDDDEEDDDGKEEGVVHAPIGLSLTVIRGVDLVRPNGIPLLDPIVSIAVGPMEAQTHPMTDERYEEKDFTSSDEDDADADAAEGNKGGGSSSLLTPRGAASSTSSKALYNKSPNRSGRPNPNSSNGPAGRVGGSGAAGSQNPPTAVSFGDMANIYGCAPSDLIRLNPQQPTPHATASNNGSAAHHPSSLGASRANSSSNLKGGLSNNNTNPTNTNANGGGGGAACVESINSTVPCGQLIQLPPRTKAETVDAFCRRTGLSPLEVSRLNPTLVNASDVIRPHLKLVVPAAPSALAAARVAREGRAGSAPNSNNNDDSTADESGTASDGNTEAKKAAATARLPKEERRRLRRRLIPSDIVWNQEMKFLDIFNEDGSLPDAIEVFVHDTDEADPQGPKRCVGYGDAPLSTSITGATVITIYPTDEAIAAFGTKRKSFRRCDKAPEGIVAIDDDDDADGDADGATNTNSSAKPVGQIIVKFAWETEKISANGSGSANGGQEPTLTEQQRVAMALKGGQHGDDEDDEEEDGDASQRYVLVGEEGTYAARQQQYDEDGNLIPLNATDRTEDEEEGAIGGAGAGGGYGSNAEGTVDQRRSSRVGDGDEEALFAGDDENAYANGRSSGRAGGRCGDDHDDGEDPVYDADGNRIYGGGSRRGGEASEDSRRRGVVGGAAAGGASDDELLPAEGQDEGDYVEETYMDEAGNYVTRRVPSRTSYLSSTNSGSKHKSGGDADGDEYSHSAANGTNTNAKGAVRRTSAVFEDDDGNAYYITEDGRRVMVGSQEDLAYTRGGDEDAESPRSGRPMPFRNYGNGAAAARVPYAEEDGTVGRSHGVGGIDTVDSFVVDANGNIISTTASQHVTPRGSANATPSRRSNTPLDPEKRAKLQQYLLSRIQNAKDGADGNANGGAKVGGDADGNGCAGAEDGDEGEGEGGADGRRGAANRSPQPFGRCDEDPAKGTPADGDLATPSPQFTNADGSRRVIRLGPRSPSTASTTGEGAEGGGAADGSGDNTNNKALSRTGSTSSMAGGGGNGNAANLRRRRSDAGDDVSGANGDAYASYYTNGSSSRNGGGNGKKGPSAASSRNNSARQSPSRQSPSRRQQGGVSKSPSVSGRNSPASRAGQQSNASTTNNANSHSNAMGSSSSAPPPILTPRSRPRLGVLGGLGSSSSMTGGGANADGSPTSNDAAGDSYRRYGSRSRPLPSYDADTHGYAFGDTANGGPSNVSGDQYRPMPHRRYNSGGGNAYGDYAGPDSPSRNYYNSRGTEWTRRPSEGGVGGSGRASPSGGSAMSRQSSVNPRNITLRFGPQTPNANAPLTNTQSSASNAGAAMFDADGNPVGPSSTSRVRFGEDNNEHFDSPYYRQEHSGSPMNSARRYGEFHHVNPVIPRSSRMASPRLKASVGERPWYPPGRPTDDSRYPLHLQKKVINEQDRIGELEALLEAEEKQLILMAQQNAAAAAAAAAAANAASQPASGNVSRTNSARRSNSVLRTRNDFM